MRSTLRAILLASLTLGGCGNKSKPTEFQYNLAFAKDSPVPNDAVLYLGEQKLASVQRPGGEYPRVSFKLPASTLLHEQVAQLGFRFETPCGRSKPIRVRLPDAKARELESRGFDSPSISLDAEIEDPSALPSLSRFWIDRASATSKVRVGEAELAPEDGKPVDLWQLDCAPRHDLTVDGKKVGVVSKGTVVEAEGATAELLGKDKAAADEHRKTAVDVAKHTKEPVPDAVYFVGRVGSCYRWELAAYSSGQGNRLEPTYFEGRSLVQLSEDPSAFLREAPEALKGSEPRFLYELVPVECGTRKTISR
jgi:hypothetical protein